MTGSGGHAITRTHGQQLARSELARAIYQPSLPARLWHDIEHWLSSLMSGNSTGIPSGLGLVLLAVVLPAAVAAVVFWLGRTSTGRQIRHRPVLEARPRSAAEYRAAAERLATAGDYQAAIIERLRAIAVDLEVREILLPMPARTAAELAAEAGAAFPAEVASLASAARLFDDVRYGDRTGTGPGYDGIRALDIRLKAAHSVPAVAARPVAVLPGLAAAGTVLGGADQPPGRLP
jgi:Domain of unknown function (DUF4129)